MTRRSLFALALAPLFGITKKPAQHVRVIVPPVTISPQPLTALEIRDKVLPELTKLLEENTKKWAAQLKRACIDAGKLPKLPLFTEEELAKLRKAAEDSNLDAHDTLTKFTAKQTKKAGTPSEASKRPLP